MIIFQDRRNRKSTTTSFEIEMVKEISDQGDVEKAEHVPETTQGKD
jgi:hypothetical protein